MLAPARPVDRLRDSGIVALWWPQEVALPHAPHRCREARLASGYLVGPNDDLFAILPLDRHRLMSGLIAALIDCEIAKDRLGLERQQRCPHLFGVKSAGLPHGVYQQLAPRICPCGLNRRRVAELLRIG